MNKRRSIRLASYDYTRPGAYFVTICSHQRQPFFGQVVNDTATNAHTQPFASILSKILPVGRWTATTQPQRDLTHRRWKSGDF
jgi:hypothetical protein